MELLTVILLALLFIASLTNIYINLHYYDNKTFQMLKSFLNLKNPSPPLPPPPSPPQKDERKKVFATFDKNGDGFITKQELIESLKNIRMNVSEFEVEDLVAGVDENGDGLIDFEEFCNFCEMFREKIESDDGDDEDLKESFGVFDKDKDGLISVEELGSVLCSLGLREGKRMEDCQEMVKKIDVDGDGMVNFVEFKLMMTNGIGGSSLVSAF